MMRHLRMILFLLAGLALLPLPALSRTLVADLSHHEIHIDSRFTGSNLLLFGAVEEPGTLVVLVRGPERNYIIRKKERIFGIWVNRTQVQLRNVPEFLSRAASHTPQGEETAALLDALHIGNNSMTPYVQGAENDEQARAFARAFTQHQEQSRLYSQQNEPITFIGDTLFKTRIHLPDTMPRGIYTAEIYLLRGGSVVASEILPINAFKTGMDAVIYDLAHRFSLLYGLLAVAIALLSGWLASRLFERFQL